MTQKMSVLVTSEELLVLNFTVPSWYIAILQMAGADFKNTSWSK
jgi:hypothetical protein